jgi:hypothetical protein
MTTEGAPTTIACLPFDDSPLAALRSHAAAFRVNSRHAYAISGVFDDVL